MTMIQAGGGRSGERERCATYFAWDVIESGQVGKECAAIRQVRKGNVFYKKKKPGKRGVAWSLDGIFLSV